MKDQNADRYKSMYLQEIDEVASSQAAEQTDIDLTVTSTMLQLVDYPLPGPDENVGTDPYNTTTETATSWPFRARK